MATAQRVFWETVIFVGFIVLLIGVWVGAGFRSARQAAGLRAQQEAALSQREEEHRDELDRLKQEWDSRSQEQTRKEAIAVFRAFEAGIHPAVPVRWGRFLKSAVRELLELPEVTFVHLSTPGGRVIVSSDEEYSAVGRFDERAEWALNLDDLNSRSGETPHILEVAAPIREEGQTVAFLWFGYDIDQAAKEAETRASSAP